MSAVQFDLSSVRFVKRIVIGSSDPSKPAAEEDIEQALALLNRCLEETPKGRIMGVEKNFSLFNIGEHQTVMQWLVYHIGFNRKPLWL